MGLDVDIRRPYRTDEPGVLSLVFDNAEFFDRSPLALTKLAHGLLDDPYTELWVAVADDVVGFIALHTGSKKSDAHTATVRIFLAEHARGQGIGTRLLEAAMRWADESHITRLVATPYVKQVFREYGAGFDRASSRRVRFFSRYGFRQEGIMRGAARSGDELHDVALLARVRSKA